MLTSHLFVTEISRSQMNAPGRGGESSEVTSPVEAARTYLGPRGASRLIEELYACQDNRSNILDLLADRLRRVPVDVRPAIAQWIYGVVTDAPNVCVDIPREQVMLRVMAIEVGLPYPS